MGIKSEFGLLFRRNPIPMWIYHPGTLQFLEVNAAAIRLYGFSRREFKKMTLRDIRPPEDLGRLSDALALDPRKTHDSGPYTHLTKDGERRRVRIVSNPVDYAGIKARLVAAYDLTDAERGDEPACDDVTGLPTRALLQRVLADRVQSAAGEPLSLLLVDIDHMRLINEGHGYETGDAVLREAARVIGALLRPGEMLFRFASDEFAILVDDSVDPMRGRELQELIAEGARVSVEAGDATITATTSSGMSAYPAHAAEPMELLRLAAKALDNARHAGGNTWVQHAVDDGGAAEQLELIARLREALDQSALELHYQPQIDLLRRDVVGLEALARWNDPEYGQQSPAKFIPVAEDGGLSGHLSRWSLREACRQARIWHRAGLHVGPVAVNISPRQFLERDFLRVVERLLELHELPASSIELELTEATLVSSSEAVRAQLQSLSRLGVSIAIDDFGTGYASLAYLKRIRVDRIKIAHSLVADIDSSPVDRSIVQALIALARSLDVGVIAEGVSTYRQAEILLSLGCSRIQGWLFSKALRAEAIGRFVESFTGRGPIAACANDETGPSFDAGALWRGAAARGR